MKIHLIGAACLSSVLLLAQAGRAEGSFSATGVEADGASGAVQAQDAKAMESVSTARIVRLSLVQGTAQLDRNTGRGFEPAFANIPILEGLKLRTQFDGLAEVEFEDNSTLRLTPGTVVSFDQLGRSATGATLTRVRVERGTAYVALQKSKANVFTLVDEQTAMELAPGSRVRLQAMKPNAELAVFDGSVRVASPSDPAVVIGKKDTLVFDPAAQTVASVDHRTDAQKYDDWDKNEAQYHTQRASFTGSSGMGMYGVNDLMYYGTFANLPGCGMMWQPYFVSAAWDPFGSGLWAWYPGMGYSWVSPYPWGWLPFHAGMWQMCGAAGWAWNPAGAWYGVNNTGLLTASGVKRVAPHVPEAGKSMLVPVNAMALKSSGLEGEGTFVFRKDSAGMGVPRQVFGNLQSASAEVRLNEGARMPVMLQARPAKGGSAAGPGLVSMVPVRPAYGRAEEGGRSQGMSEGSSARSLAMPNARSTSPSTTMPAPASPPPAPHH